MTAIGSKCTRPLIDRTLICNAILYHFQITLICGRINRPFIPLTLFLLSRPLEQLEFIRLSNSKAEICFVLIFHFTYPTATTIYAPTRTPKSISTTSLSTLNKYLVIFKSLARDDLLINFLVFDILHTHTLLRVFKKRKTEKEREKEKERENSAKDDCIVVVVFVCALVFEDEYFVTFRHHRSNIDDER